jgi:hypothetical protein
MLDVTVTVIALASVVAACSAGLLALPWTEAEVRESVTAWRTLRAEVGRLIRSRAPVAQVPARVVVVGAR